MISNDDQNKSSSDTQNNMYLICMYMIKGIRKS